MKRPAWTDQIFEELDRLEPLDRIKASGELIFMVTHLLLADLGDYRRRAVADLVDQDDWDDQKLAETIGSRTIAIQRLAKEGRRLRERT